MKKIKLKKDWRAWGEIQKAGKILSIRDKDILNFLKENDYIENENKKTTKKTVEKINK